MLKVIFWGKKKCLFYMLSSICTMLLSVMCLPTQPLDPDLSNLQSQALILQEPVLVF